MLPYILILSSIVKGALRLEISMSIDIMRTRFHLFMRMKKLKIISVLDFVCLDFEEHFGGLLNLQDHMSQVNFYFQGRPFDSKLKIGFQGHSCPWNEIID